MPQRTPIAVPGAENDAPTYRYWGRTKPPKNADVLCAVQPRIAADDPAKATLRLYGPIDSWGGYWGTSAKEVAQALDALGDDVTDIQLRVNSPGGSVFEGLAILNLLRAHPATVTAVVDGLAASAASYVVAGCDQRVMAPGTQMMIHDPWSSAWGCNAAEMAKAATTLDKIAQGLADLYADVAGGTSEGWRDVMREETWYTADEALSAGLCDQVAVVPNLGAASTAGDDEPDTDDDGELLDAFDLSVFSHAGRPQAPAPTPPNASAVGSTHTQGGSAVAFTTEQLTTMRDKLQLSETADEAAIVAAVEAVVDESLEERPPSNDRGASAKVPDGMSLVETTVLDDLKTGAAAGRAAQKQLADQARDALIEDAIKAGKTSPARRDHWAKAYDADPEGTKATLAALEAGLVPVTEQGHDTGQNTNDATHGVDDAALDRFAAGFGLSKEALRG